MTVTSERLRVTVGCVTSVCVTGEKGRDGEVRWPAINNVGLNAGFSSK